MRFAPGGATALTPPQCFRSGSVHEERLKKFLQSAIPPFVFGTDLQYRIHESSFYKSAFGLTSLSTWTYFMDAPSPSSSGYSRTNGRRIRFIMATIAAQPQIPFLHFLLSVRCLAISRRKFSLILLSLRLHDTTAARTHLAVGRRSHLT